MKVEELIKKVRGDVEKLMEREDDLFFHTYAYLKRYVRRRWAEMIKMEAIATVLALHLNGLPITVRTFSEIYFGRADKVTESRARFYLDRLAGYRIILPSEVVKMQTYQRSWKLNPMFLFYLERPLKSIREIGAKSQDQSR